MQIILYGLRGGGVRQDFQNGVITWTPLAGDPTLPTETSVPGLSGAEPPWPDRPGRFRICNDCYEDVTSVTHFRLRYALV
ncbi:MAG: hypothetical protein ABWY04_12175 [Arthrobacter sp.]